MSKLAAARRKQQRTPVCERAAEMAAGPMCSTHSSKSALSRCCKKPCRWPMSVGLQELVPAGGRRGSARVAHLAGGATRPPQRLRAAARPFPNAGFFGCFAKQPAFISRPPRRHPFQPPLRPKPPAPATGAPPPRQRTAPFGPGSTVPRSASGGRGGHTDFGKRCFWVVLPAGVWSRATTEWIETLGAGLTALNGHPNHVDYVPRRLGGH